MMKHSQDSTSCIINPNSKQRQVKKQNNNLHLPAGPISGTNVAGFDPNENVSQKIKISPDDYLGKIRYLDEKYDESEL